MKKYKPSKPILPNSFAPILVKDKRKYGLRDILNDLKPGQSFLIESGKEYNALRQLCHNYGFKVTTKPEGNKLRRVWRLG